MAQVISVTPSVVTGDNESVAVPQAGSTLLIEVPVYSIAELGIQIDVVGKLLGGFVIMGRMSAKGAYMTLYSAAANFTTPAGAVIAASGDLTTQAAGTSGWVLLNVLGLHSLQVFASSGDAAGSTVSARVIGKG